MTDFTTADYFSDESVAADTYPYFDFLLDGRRVWREPHHGVVMVRVRGGARRAAGHGELLVVQHRGRAGSRFPVELAGDDVTGAGRAAPRRAADQRPDRHLRPAEAHRAPRAADAADHAEAPQGERGVHVAAGRPPARRVRRRRRVRVHRRLRAARSRCSSSPTCSACPRRTTTLFREAGVGTAAGGTGRTERPHHHPLEFLYGSSPRYIEDRRREPRDDVMTGLATATFPDGSIPEVDRRRADRRQPVRRRPGDHGPAARHRAAADRRRARAAAAAARRPRARSRASSRRRCGSRARSRATSGWRDVPTDRRRRRHPGRQHGDGAARRGQPRPAPVRATRTSCDIDRANARQHIAFGHGIHTCPGAPLARAEGRVSLERLLDRTDDIRISEAEHGPAGARRYEYPPTYMLRGLRAAPPRVRLSGS